MENSVKKMSQIEKGIYQGRYLVFMQLKIKDFIFMQKAGHFLVYAVLQNFCQSLSHTSVKYSKIWELNAVRSHSNH